MLYLEEEEKMHFLSSRQSSPAENSQTSPFKLIDGSDGTTTFLPLDTKIGGRVSHDRPNLGQFLTREQANYVYKKWKQAK